MGAQGAEHPQRLRYDYNIQPAQRPHRYPKGFNLAIEAIPRSGHKTQ